MKFENVILHSLFAACFAVCVLTVGAMITATSAPAADAVSQASSVVAGAQG